MCSFALAVSLLLAISVSGGTLNPKLPAALLRKLAPQDVISDKIIGGDEVPPNSLPFQVSIQYSWYLSPPYVHLCSGSIIDENFVLTSAYCCYGANVDELRIIAGDHDLELDEGKEQEATVSAMHIHPSYNPSNHFNDICLMELSYPLILNKFVSPINLPKPMQNFSGDAVVSGWGAYNADSPYILEAVRVPFVSNQDCTAAYGELLINDNMICAGEEGKDSCNGDWGSPLVYQGVLCGIFSWENGCGSAEYPGIYTEVSHFIDFVNNHTKSFDEKLN